MESRPAYQPDLSESNNGIQSCHASVNYPVCNPNETNIYTNAENILSRNSGNEKTYNCNEDLAGPSNDTFRFSPNLPTKVARIYYFSKIEPH